MTGYRGAKRIGTSRRSDIEIVKGHLRSETRPVSGDGYVFKTAVAELRKDGWDIKINRTTGDYVNHGRLPTATPIKGTSTVADVKESGSRNGSTGSKVGSVNGPVVKTAKLKLSDPAVKALLKTNMVTKNDVKSAASMADLTKLHVENTALYNSHMGFDYVAHYDAPTAAKPERLPIAQPIKGTTGTAAQVTKADVAKAEKRMISANYQASKMAIVNQSGIGGTGKTSDNSIAEANAAKHEQAYHETKRKYEEGKASAKSSPTAKPIKGTTGTAAQRITPAAAKPALPAAKPAVRTPKLPKGGRGALGLALAVGSAALLTRAMSGSAQAHPAMTAHPAESNGATRTKAYETHTNGVTRRFENGRLITRK